ncbi:MAG: SUMF1/EgtB/PvdO family nonheme iron enzyme [Rhodobacteraceae bacterium]|nr:SUMF1/EgtB/PvdO family nonheme iron enzyme [Paracoccaceae bacterium]
MCAVAAAIRARDTHGGAVGACGAGRDRLALVVRKRQVVHSPPRGGEHRGREDQRYHAAPVALGPRRLGRRLDRPRPSRFLRRKPFGLHDTIGNVWEWCHDPGFNDGKRICRGGSFDYVASYSRSSFRNDHAAEYRDSTTGVRPARRLEP